jgi:hypothetical protein
VNTTPPPPPPPPPVTVTLTQGSPTSAGVAYGAGYSGQLTVPNGTGTVSYTETSSTDSADVVVTSTGAISAATSLAPGTYTATGADSDTNGDAGTWSFPLTVGMAASTTALSLSATKVTYGDERVEHLSVTVSPQYSGVTPTGTITIKESTTTLCVINLPSVMGPCNLSNVRLQVGTYSLVATYGGSTNFDTSASVKEILTVTKATSKTTLKLSSSKVTYGHEQTEHLSVTVSPEFGGSTPTGRVTVEGSGMTLCVITLSSGKGSCTLSVKRVKAGTYRFVATYGRSTNFEGSTSAKETLTVAK